ncbi:putative ribosome biogenesis protein urb1 [Phaeomoniella chlamydospora]|uniref:Putative ribosome biogenesis protein urb1 n=1 Tax=Phaeomoniella chlamydospora TaxID=158046 RepID=A0A0G2E7R8_PHACM|nr:putative ribosome biogenesis protein urb1 [Phaeomoniella chlamydospora]
MNGAQNGEPHVKRRRISKDENEGPNGATSSIASVKDLRRSLGGKGDNKIDVRTGVQAFKEFLQSLGNSDQSSKSRKLQVLKTYLEEQSPEKSGLTINLPDLISTWNTAIESQNNSLLSSVPSVLALLIRVISSELELRDLGLDICKDLLQRDQLRFFDRGLTATKTKEHLISPCIRLLTEIVSFDGGTVAGLVYAKRDITLKRIDQFLNQRKAEADQNEQRSKKPSLRRIAQRYVIAILKYLTGKAKADLLTQGNLFKAFFQGIKSDEADIILDALEVLERNVAKDTTLTRSQKQRFWLYSTLVAIINLYSFEGIDAENEETTSKVQQQAHRLLRIICTSHDEGILRRQTGWYPHGMNPESQLIDGLGDDYIDLGLESRFATDRYADKPPIRNSQIAGFIQNLRPDDPAQMELLIEIFKVAPELVADYFSKKSAFPVEPKPTTQWLGFSAMVFSMIRLPVPTNCGWNTSEELPVVPPPTSVVIENVLPRPLDKAMLTRCLNLNHEIITLFAVRALSAAFEKLGDVLSMFDRAPGAGRFSWRQTSVKLKEAFSQRCPPIKDVITAYHRTAKMNHELHEPVTELLASYYKYLPDTAVAEKFDVSVALVDSLRRMEKRDGQHEENSLDQLTYLLEIAQASTDTKWWNKPENLDFSPFTSLLKVIAGTSQELETSRRIQRILTDLCIEHGLLNDEKSFKAFLASLTDESGNPVATQIFQAIDQCVGRLVRRPVQYEDFLMSLEVSQTSSIPRSLLAASMCEQCHFITQSIGTPLFLGWLNQFLYNLVVAGEGQELISGLRHYVLKKIPDAKGVFDRQTNTWSDAPGDLENDVEMTDMEHSKLSQKANPDEMLLKLFGPEEEHTASLSTLQKWEKQEVEAAITSGTVAGLVKCLLSDEDEIRRQAYLNIQRFMHKVQSSELAGWQAIYVALGETVESVKIIGLDNPLPSIIAELASRCIDVLNQPLNQMFAKVNKFLNKSPIWSPSKLCSYWVDQLLMQEPEHDDGYFEEALWLLQLLTASLKTHHDLELYRKAKIFERILAWSESPGLHERLQLKVYELVYKAAQVDHSNTLITRMGILGWLSFEGTKYGECGAIAGALHSVVMAKLAQEDFRQWSRLVNSSVAKC